MSPRGPRRAGFTLAEALITVLVVATMVGIVLALLVSGSRLFARSVEVLRGPQAALVVLEQLEQDVLQVLQAPGDPRPPMRVTTDARLAFYVPHPEWSSLNTVLGQPRVWSLVPVEGASGRFHPARDGVPLEGVELAGWDLELLEPDAEAQRAAWTLQVEITVPGQGLFSRPYRAYRLLVLPQPTANFHGFAGHGEDLFTEHVKMLRPPPGDPAFLGLGPPDVAVAGPPGEGEGEGEVGPVDEEVTE